MCVLSCVSADVFGTLVALDSADQFGVLMYWLIGCLRSCVC